MDGRTAPYSDCWEGEYLNEDRGAQEYTVEEYDFGTLEKKKYKVVLDETSKIDLGNLHGLYDYLDAEMIGCHFIVKDGVLKKYLGESSNLIIPEGVVEIDYNPFVSVRDFDLILIPKTLVNIPKHIFTECTTKSIHVDKDHPKYYSKDGCLIDKETNTLVWAFAATSIPNDNSIKEIGRRAFAKRKDIEKIEIPDSITKIGWEAFYGCDKLTSVVISNSTVIIDGGAFSECTSLSAIKLPDTIEVVNGNTFSGCTSLVSIEIPDSVQTIERFAFWECGSLKEIRTSNVGIDLSEVISGKSYIRNGDEWALNNDVNNINFTAFSF
jgi:hypothetical protein